VDWIQVYAVAILVIGILGRTVKHGEPRDDYNAVEIPALLLLALPHYGRVFGWW